MEPLSVAVQAIRRVPEPSRTSSETCLIFGTGAVGLLCSVAAQATDYSRFIIADIDENRLRFAQSNRYATATQTVKSRRGATTEEKLSIANDTAVEIASAVWEDGSIVGRVDDIFECTGVESCIQTSIYVSESQPIFLRPCHCIGMPTNIFILGDETRRYRYLGWSWSA